MDKVKCFIWHGIDSKGAICKGISKAPSVQNVKKELLGKGIALISHKEKVDKIWVKKSYSKELIYFFSSLSIFIDSGINIISALKILKNKKTLKTIKTKIENIVSNLESGSSLSAALNNYNQVFDRMIVHIIKIGEESGELALVCNQIAEYLSLKKAFSKKIKQALFLPALTFSFAIILIFFIFIIIIPRFELTLSSLNKPLPWLTEVVFSISRGFTLTNFLLIGSFCLLMASMFFVYIKKYKAIIEKFIFQLPVFGKLIHLFDLIQFIRSFIMLTNCGVSIVETLAYTKMVIKNLFFQNKISELTDQINNGLSIEESMNALGDRYFPPELIAIVSVGESSGSLASMLGRALVLLEEELNTFLDLLIKILNPLVMIFLGFFIALLMAAIYIPIFNLASSI